MLISLAVRPVIPDTTALTAQRALQRLGLHDLAGLRREVGWQFEAFEDQTPADLATRLLSTDVLVNYNTHRGRWWPGPLEAGAVPGTEAGGGHWAGVLVEDRDDPAALRLQGVLTARLGFHHLRVARHCTIWWVASPDGRDARALAQRAAALLFVNPHGQTTSTLGGYS